MLGITLIRKSRKKIRRGRCINGHNRICIVCGQYVILNRKAETHHIENYPRISAIVHRKCHYKIHHNESLVYLRPIFSRLEGRVYKDISQKRQTIIKARQKMIELKHICNEL